MASTNPVSGGSDWLYQYVKEDPTGPFGQLKCTSEPGLFPSERAFTNLYNSTFGFRSSTGTRARFRDLDFADQIRCLNMVTRQHGWSSRSDFRQSMPTGRWSDFATDVEREPDAYVSPYRELVEGRMEPPSSDPLQQGMLHNRVAIRDGTNAPCKLTTAALL